MRPRLLVMLLQLCLLAGSFSALTGCQDRVPPIAKPAPVKGELVLVLRRTER